MILRLGTRSSRLALWQARKAADLLRDSGVECEIVTIETHGDDVTDRPLPEIGGDGVFTERIEGALRAAEIDIAVHSLKDLPVVDPDELCVGAVIGREETREALVSREGRVLAALAPGAVIGSSSTRRQAQLLSLRPDVVIMPIRGNVETRIRKVESGEYDATLLAGVGILRLGLGGKVTQWLELSEVLPAPGQGAIAVQCRTADTETRRVLARVDEPALRAETDAERGFLRALGGGCSAPVGAFAQVRGHRLHLRGRISSLDGRRTVDVESEGDDHAALVAELAARALRNGAAELIAAAGRSTAVLRSPAGLPLRRMRVVVTRPREQAEALCRLLAAAGAVPLAIPLIRPVPLEDTHELDAAIGRLESYHWIAFASANAVEFFMKRLAAVRGAGWPAGTPRVAAVGPATTAALGRHGVGVYFAPAVHTGAALAEGISAKGQGLSGMYVLMPRALEGREEAAALLRHRGALVEDVPAYRTVPIPLAAEDVAALEGRVDAVLFASGSAVNAWCDEAERRSFLSVVARRAIIACIGPSTASTAQDRGMRVDVEAASHTAEGLVAALALHVSRAQGGTR